jgi:hypothetical protein
VRRHPRLGGPVRRVAACRRAGGARTALDAHDGAHHGADHDADDRTPDHPAAGHHADDPTAGGDHLTPATT